jgi:ornithine cyclodeaminase/alanine dehydrogenase-like protein (mu-crystallin family)
MSYTDLLVLSSTDVDRVTSAMAPEEVEHLMANVFYTLSTNSGSNSSNPLEQSTFEAPHRIGVQAHQHKILFMPARIDSIGTTMKAVSIPTSTAAAPGGLPGTTLVFDKHTGAVKGVVNARNLTALRNAAGKLRAS